MHIEVDAWEHNSQLRPKASLHKGVPQRGRAVERPATFSKRLAFGVSLEFCSQASNSMQLNAWIYNPTALSNILEAPSMQNGGGLN